MINPFTYTFMNFKILLVFAILATNISFSQAKLRDNQKTGYIILSDGSKNEVAIEVDDAAQPWTFQSGIRYYDKALLTGTRIKREQKKDVVPGEVVEYGFENRRFLYVNYYVKGKGEDALKATAERFKGDKNTDFFAEIIHEGKVQLLKFYLPPDISDDDYDDDAIIQKYIKDAEEGYDILIKREGVSSKAIQEINVKTFFEDCPFVLNKFEKDLYKIKPVSGLKKLIAKDGLSGIQLENASLKVVKDYDDRCGNK